MSDKSILVMRATGVQGRGAVSHLVKDGWNVRALVSDTTNERAAAIKSLGSQVSLHQGSWQDPSTIEAALKGCQALVLNQMPSFGDDGELQEARLVLKLAKEAGVQHVVYSSSLFLSNPNIKQDIGHLSGAAAVLGKAEVEELVRSCGMTWTLLRPGYFNTNLFPPLVHYIFPEAKEGKFVNSYGPDCVMTLVDPDDIGAFVAAAVGGSAKFGSQTITVVGENLRFNDMMNEFSKACGHQFEVVYRTPEETERDIASPFISGHVMCIGVDKFVDMDEIKKWGVPLTSFKQFLEKHKHELPRGPIQPNAGALPLP
jgi:uncharacterized protein YbjT (DUF2867 family)